MYFDNAATTAHKPEEVARAVYDGASDLLHGFYRSAPVAARRLKDFLPSYLICR